MNSFDYNKIVKEHTQGLYRFLFKSLRDKDEVSDVLQDSFLKLWEHKDNIQTEKIKSWLYTTAYHFMLKVIKSKQRVLRSDEAMDIPVKENNNFESKELVDVLLNKLPEQQKTIVLLRDMEGYNYEEIGKIMNLNESQVKVYLFRARQKVRDDLKALKVEI